MKSTKTLLSLCALIIAQSSICLAYDTSDEHLYDNAVKFASQYEYHEGDIEKSMSLYKGIWAMSGVDKTKDGKEYEFPGYYNDTHAGFFGCYDLQKGEMNLSVNGQKSECGSKCVLYNGVTLTPVTVFEELGCEISFNEELYVAELTKNGTVLELLPQLTAMRKNKGEGYYVPLEACARFVDDELYVPLRAVAEEFDIVVDWDGKTHTVVITSDNNNFA